MVVCLTQEVQTLIGIFVFQLSWMFFLWRMCLYSIPTRERLSYRCIRADSIMFPTCSISVETIDHVFTRCMELLDIWHHVTVWWEIQIPNPIFILTLLTWSDSIRMMVSQRKALQVVVMMVFLCIWNFRNSTILGQ